MSSTTTPVQSEFAKRQLERMGWKEGSGLGKDRQGRAAPIVVQKRADVTGGLGIEKEKVRQVQHTIQDEWWKDTLGDTLHKLSNKKDKKKKRKRENDSSCSNETTKKKIYTDEELFIATGGARFGMRAGKTRNQAKWRRTGELDSKELVLQQQDLTFTYHEDVVKDTTTVPSPGIEGVRTVVETTTTTLMSVCSSSTTTTKEKKKKSRTINKAKKGDEISDDKSVLQKTKKVKHFVLGVVEAKDETGITDNTNSATPSKEKKKKRKTSTIS